MSDDLKKSRKAFNNRSYVFFKRLKKPSDLDQDITMAQNLVSDQIRALGKEILQNTVLNRDQAQALVNYIKILKELRKEEDEYLKSLTPEQRSNIANAKAIKS